MGGKKHASVLQTSALLQTVAACGRANSHRIPLVKLLCMSEKRRGSWPFGQAQDKPPGRAAIRQVCGSAPHPL